MEVVVWGASFLGLALGAVMAFVIGKLLLLPVVEKSSYPAFMARWGIAGLVVSVLPAFFLSFVIGGTFGGSLGERLFFVIGLPWSGVSLGVGIGIAVVFALVLLAGTGLSLLIGRRLLRYLEDKVRSRR